MSVRASISYLLEPEQIQQPVERERGWSMSKRLYSFSQTLLPRCILTEELDSTLRVDSWAQYAFERFRMSEFRRCLKRQRKLPVLRHNPDHPTTGASMFNNTGKEAFQERMKAKKIQREERSGTPGRTTCHRYRLRHMQTHKR